MFSDFPVQSRNRFYRLVGDNKQFPEVSVTTGVSTSCLRNGQTFTGDTGGPDKTAALDYSINIYKEKVGAHSLKAGCTFFDH